VEWVESAARAVWVVWVELAARAVWVAQVPHSPRQGVPVDVRTGNTSPSTEAARLTRIGQPRTDSAEAPVATPSPLARQARSNGSHGRVAMLVQVAVRAIAAA